MVKQDESRHTGRRDGWKSLPRKRGRNVKGGIERKSRWHRDTMSFYSICTILIRKTENAEE